MKNDLKKFLFMFIMFMFVMPSVVFAGTINGLGVGNFGAIGLLVFTLLLVAAPIIGLVLVIWSVRYLYIIFKYKKNDPKKYKKLSSGMLKSLKKYIIALLVIVLIAGICLVIEHFIS